MVLYQDFRNHSRPLGNKRSGQKSFVGHLDNLKQSLWHDVGTVSSRRPRFNPQNHPYQTSSSLGLSAQETSPPQHGGWFPLEAVGSAHFAWSEHFDKE